MSSRRIVEPVDVTANRFFGLSVKKETYRAPAAVAAGAE